jgi:DNA-binding GntR family transcriptional regulator
MSDGYITDLPSVQVRRESTAEQVAAALRGLIVAGTINPGTHLSEGPVSQQLGVSRNTVREALQILVSQGLVRREIHRGAYVSELDADDIRDLFRVRRLIEVAAVRELAGGDADLSELRAQVDAVAGAPTPAEALEAELQFWQTLVELVHSERFGALHASAVSELQLSVALSGDESVDAPRISRQLRSLLTAMRRGDSEKAAAIATSRLESEAERHLARVLG